MSSRMPHHVNRNRGDVDRRPEGIDRQALGEHDSHTAWQGGNRIGACHDLRRHEEVRSANALAAAKPLVGERRIDDAPWPIILRDDDVLELGVRAQCES